MAGTKVTPAERKRIRHLRYVEGLTVTEAAARTGRGESTIARHAPGHPGKIDNTLLRERFEASSSTAAEVARALDWMASGRPDTSRVNRTLGLKPDLSGRGGSSLRRLIDAETAGRIADAIGVTPWEIGA